MINDNTMSELALNCGSYNYVFTVDDHLFVIYSDGVGQVYKLMIIDSDNRTLYDSAIGSSINKVWPAYCIALGAIFCLGDS